MAESNFAPNLGEFIEGHTAVESGVPESVVQKRYTEDDVLRLTQDDVERTLE